MGQGASGDPVVQFYETHPINEAQILHDLARDGIGLEGLTETALSAYDQDHYGGLHAVDVLAEKAGVGAGHHVLDVCSGMGGPARYLANRLGCRVTGLDVTESRVEGARRLTSLVRLEDRVVFRHGDALAMPFADASFDVVIGQEAWVHVPDKPRLIQECARVVKPGGVIAFTDIVRREALDETALERLRREMAFAEPETLDGYVRLLEGIGARVEVRDDLSGWWTEILNERLAMYRGLRDTTVARFGEAHFEHWDATYAFFVDLFAEGRLGGGRFVARRDGH